MGLSDDLSCEAGSFSCCCPNPTGSFNQRSEALFPRAGALGYMVCFTAHCSSRFICARVWGPRVLPPALPALFSPILSPALSVYLCAIIGPQGLLVVRLPVPFVPHSASLGPATAMRVLSTQVPISTPPTGLDESLFFISLVLDPLAIRFDSLSVLVLQGGAVCLPTPPSWF